MIKKIISQTNCPNCGSTIQKEKVTTNLWMRIFKCGYTIIGESENNFIIDKECSIKNKNI